MLLTEKNTPIIYSPCVKHNNTFILPYSGSLKYFVVKLTMTMLTQVSCMYFFVICCSFLSAQQFEIEKDKYFKNSVQSYTYYNLKNYAKLGKPVDKGR